MITMTGLVFSITVVALQLAAGQFSSRVMRDFLRDRVIQVTFGVFVATFTYALILQRSVRGVSSGGATVPQLGMTAAFLLVLASITLFVVYINRTTARWSSGEGPPAVCAARRRQHTGSPVAGGGSFR